MTVGELREALAPYPNDAEVLVQGTSVSVRPLRVMSLREVRAEETDEHWQDAEQFEGEDDGTVVVLTQ